MNKNPRSNELLNTPAQILKAAGAMLSAKAGFSRHGQPARDPLWYKKAMFYELSVRAFHDSNADGYGDFVGLTEKLDYLEWLGVDCIWLLPFFQSPLKDGGYDVSDYYSILPEAGTIIDFQNFIEAAHARGIRVIADMVLNHTSDQHDWFQESRNPASPKRDWYVWSDTNDKYPGARVMFPDVEQSCWTWDDQAGAYYFHRFYAHQPDLNYDNPEVQEQMLDVCRFWLDLGIDGFRLDAVPHLYEREGTRCEGLPETHQYLKRLRAVVDEEYEDIVLLAEANEWPSDLIPYFGDDDECHMAFHFPLMPRMFMAVRRETSLPIVEIMEQTPALPRTGQWGLFLRNHDELTLEMVSDEERDYMWDEYARDPRMKLNLGIRRRLAPLLENSRHQMELFHAMLLSMPGSPIIYYGDEIGMGDNVYLGDRDGVRTPMPWNSDRNAGFSRAHPHQLYMPVLLDPVYGYQAVNVESQFRNQSSFMRWFRRLIQVRQEHDAFALGSLEFLRPKNDSVLAYLRHYDGDVILCVNNLSGRAQSTELNLRKYKGCELTELIGLEKFGAITTAPYRVTLSPHGFYWLRISQPKPQK